MIGGEDIRAIITGIEPGEAKRQNQPRTELYNNRVKRNPRTLHRSPKSGAESKLKYQITKLMGKEENIHLRYGLKYKD